MRRGEGKRRGGKREGREENRGEKKREGKGREKGPSPPPQKKNPGAATVTIGTPMVIFCRLIVFGDWYTAGTVLVDL